jgi:photosystem I subunit 9
MENSGQKTITFLLMVQEAKYSYLLIPKSHLNYFNHVSIIRTKWFRSAPVVATIWITLTAGIIVEFNRFVPDLLFHPMSF